jgi:hypothetical protein
LFVSRSPQSFWSSFKLTLVQSINWNVLNPYWPAALALRWFIPYQMGLIGLTQK